MGRIRVRPGKPMSALAVAVGIAFILLGVFVIIPKFGAFGVVWTLVALGICIYHGFNLFSNRGAPLYQVDVDVDPGESAAGSPDVAARLEQLEQLKRNGQITADEYDQQRARILRDL